MSFFVNSVTWSLVPVEICCRIRSTSKRFILGKGLARKDKINTIYIALFSKKAGKVVREITKRKKALTDCCMSRQ